MKVASMTAAAIHHGLMPWVSSFWASGWGGGGGGCHAGRISTFWQDDLPGERLVRS